LSKIFGCKFLAGREREGEREREREREKERENERELDFKRRHSSDLKKRQSFKPQTLDST